MEKHSLRSEKNCLNCGAEVPERFCSHCGQENKVPHETFSHLFKHFVADIFHYDSQFFNTLKYLVFRPGFLSREYSAGKRVKYVNPIKLYVFISFVCFFGIFALQPHAKHDGHKNTITIGQDTTEQHAVAEEEELKEMVVTDTLSSDTTSRYRYHPAIAATDTAHTDTAAVKRKHATGDESGVSIKEALDSVDVISNPAKFGKDVYKEIVSNPKSGKSKQIVSVDKAVSTYSTVEEYEEAQAKLPDSLRDEAGTRLFSRRILELKEKYGKDGADIQESFLEVFKHNIPKFMFVMLPLFAMFMTWLYRRGQWLYSDHAIFTIHFHAFVYILSLLVVALQRIFHSDNLIGWGLLLSFIYLVLALKNNYKQSVRKTIFKSFLLMTTYTVAMFTMFVIVCMLLVAVFI
ncbi:DUF3667 domain-containing protein [Chitinophaga sp. Mgbs1]|uniref:DUF3667 domain-containing protein n=1 Tax=Chitinophaga solisilvae TaxID=1233460 RepID=A0A9Q5GVA9_9BACT|nr:DUF3667 domain-containing protein [Chitinophaga solisilvae]